MSYRLYYSNYSIAKLKCHQKIKLSFYKRDNLLIISYVCASILMIVIYCILAISFTIAISVTFKVQSYKCNTSTAFHCIKLYHKSEGS